MSTLHIIICTHTHTHFIHSFVHFTTFSLLFIVSSSSSFYYISTIDPASHIITLSKNPLIHTAFTNNNNKDRLSSPILTYSRRTIGQKIQTRKKLSRSTILQSRVSFNHATFDSLTPRDACSPCTKYHHTLFSAPNSNSRLYISLSPFICGYVALLMFTDYLPLNNNQQQTGETTLPRKTLPLFHAFPLLASFVFCCFIFTLGPFSTVKNSAHYFFFRRSLFCHPPSLSIASLDIVISLQLLCLSLSFFSSLWSICRSFLSVHYSCNLDYLSHRIAHCYSLPFTLLIPSPCFPTTIPTHHTPRSIPFSPLTPVSFQPSFHQPLSVPFLSHPLLSDVLTHTLISLT